MNARALWRVAWFASVVSAATAQPAAQREPHIGYLYPAGSRAGATVEVLAGGQALKGASGVHVSGSGVTAQVVRHVPPLRPLDKEMMDELRERLAARWGEQYPGMAALGGFGTGRRNQATKAAATTATTSRSQTTTDARAALPAKGKGRAQGLPDHPLIHRLEQLNPREFAFVIRDLRDRDKRQQNMQIAETLILRVTVAPGTSPGVRELRIVTPNGLTNPLRFEVGNEPEVLEREPNDPDWSEIQQVTLPVTINGQITPGDVDRFRFAARKGQKLVVETHARSLMPFLADAVPGWFQATVTLRDARGREVAFADDYRFNPDPVLMTEIPGDGEYRLEISDALYRGRDDFVYRVTAGERPFVTGIFPLGGRTGSDAPVWVGQWAKPYEPATLDTSPGLGDIRETEVHIGADVSNRVSYAVDTLPETFEKEPNDNRGTAQPVDLPRIVNGTIARPGDTDWFRFRGRAGERVVAEIAARRLGSPLDSLLRLTSARGDVIAWNDDFKDKASDLLTHQADSLLSATLPADGEFCISVGDSQRHGGAQFAYRLRVGPPRPDFTAFITPASINLRGARSVAARVFAVRRDGFDGDVEVSVPAGTTTVSLSGGRIPAGRDSIRLTLRAAGETPAGLAPLRLEARAQVGGKWVTRTVLPAEDMMQAFAYQHLVPAQELLASFDIPPRPGAAGPPSARGILRAIRRTPPSIEIASAGQVRLPVGGSADVQLLAPRWIAQQKLKWELSEPPKGVTLGESRPTPGGLALTLHADATTTAGLADNLIVEAFTETPTSGTLAAGPKQQNRRVSLGMLPAIPFQIVNR